MLSKIIGSIKYIKEIITAPTVNILLLFAFFFIILSVSKINKQEGIIFPNTPPNWMLIIVGCILFGASILLYVYISKKKVNINEEIFPPTPPVSTEAQKKLTNILKDELSKYMEKELYNDVIRFGSSISRVLWLNGEYEARVEIGKMVEEAATRLGQKLIKAETLIDDIGWTLVPQKKFEEAKNNIEHGMQIATAIKNFYLVAKAKRHLSGIEIEKGRSENALKLLEESIVEANKIEDSTKRDEITAGIYYGLAEAYYLSGDYIKAEEMCLKSRNIYENINDKERYAKHFAQLGKIKIEQNNLKSARDIFIAGLEYSKKIKRLDEITRNYVGLAITYAKMNEKRKATNNLNQAIKLLRHIPLVFWGNMVTEITQLRNKLKGG
ncbi:MAG: tetratricopeptide repeat protein [candidate division WOR-3 bacterium]